MKNIGSIINMRILNKKYILRDTSECRIYEYIGGKYMPTLSCSVRNCYYNKENRCCKEDILVEGKHATTTDATLCDSFKIKKDSYGNTCGTECTPNNSLKVACRAENCSYNQKCMCNATHIDIVGTEASKSEQTECRTFMMK